jgi:hypothetical protein
VERSRTAYHEAGHTVISYRLGFELGTTTINPDHAEGLAGFSQGEAEWFDGSRDRDYIISLYAGYATEKRYDPKADESTSSGDNNKAVELLQSHPDLSEGELRQEAEKLVGQYWAEIEALAALLLGETTVSGDDAGYICDAIEEGEDWRQSLSVYRQRMRQFRNKV